jgi:hypothetical protein
VQRKTGVGTRYRGAIKDWTQAEMIQMYAFLEAGKSYSFIAERLNRSVRSVEARAQRTDWKAWKKIQLPTEHISVLEVQEQGRKEAQEQIKERQKEEFILQLVNALLGVCRNDFPVLILLKKGNS